jgi:lipoprotein-anchoring transpeptidase ErfK/SrfK
VSWEPVAVNKSLSPGNTQIWRSGPGATGNFVLTKQAIFTNSVWDKEGVAVNTSVGTVTVQCAAAPPVTKDQIAVTINCTSDPEKIRVTNNGYRAIQVVSIGTLYSPTSKEPFTLNYTINPKKTQIWYAGDGATGDRVLTKSFILTNSVYDREGVRVVTSVGTITVKCPEAPPDPFGGAKWIEVNLSTQYLVAWQNGVRVNETYVSTGRPGYETPTGTWYVNTKYRYDDMQGCINGDCWFVPDVPWTMYFTYWGHALHGAYWHHNFGQTMSHGCVNLPLPFAEWLYSWTPIGTPVVVHY